MQAKYILLIVIVIIFITSCQKPEGVGGTSTIKGIATMIELNSLNEIKDSFPAYDENIYIIYGENEVFDDDIKTHYDGKYIFTNLRKGNYKIFAYSECRGDSCIAPSIPFIINVEINENNQSINAPEIIIKNY